MTKFDRRLLLRRSAQLAGGSFGLSLAPQMALAGNEPHFFVHLCISGGVDASYLFDARPLRMTDQGKIANYLYKNSDSAMTTLADPKPIRYDGINNNYCLRTGLTNELMKFKDYFSIVNGVMMNVQFLGHGNNMYELFTNSPNPNGSSFVPVIGSQLSQNLGITPLESLHFNGFEGDGNSAPANFNLSARFSGTDLSFAEELAKVSIQGDSPIQKFLQRRAMANGRGAAEQDLFGMGSRDLALALGQTPALLTRLTDVKSSDLTGTEFERQVQLGLKYLQGGVTRSLTLMLDHDGGNLNADVHSENLARNQFVLYQSIAKSIESLFTLLHNTKIKGRDASFADFTTVLVSSEFSRTMRQDGKPIDNTGTDHNTLTNTFLLAGRGIRGGQVVGASDLTDIQKDGKYVDHTKAHEIKDPTGNKIMGKPYDWADRRVSQRSFEDFDQHRYLSSSNVVNTLLEVFGVDKKSRFKVDAADRDPAPFIKELLT